MKTLSIALVLAAAPLTAAADDCVRILSAPAVLDAPGRYCLAGDLEFTPLTMQSHSAILVTADSVTVDLKGFTITSTVPGWGLGVSIYGAQRGVTVVNGTVAGFFNGVKLESGASRADACRVENMTVRDGSAAGIRVYGTGCVVRGNRVTTIVGRSDIGFNTLGIGLFGWSNPAIDNDVSEIYGGTAGLYGYGFVGNACNRCVFEDNRV